VLAFVLAISAGPVGCGSARAGADGQSLVLVKCVRCHTIDRVRAKLGRDRAAWTVSIGRMQGHGLSITAEEQERIIAFLSSGKAF
jgi:hypothetical protein